MAHGTLPITGASVGTVIDNLAGNVTQILYTGAPTSYEVPTFDPGSGLPTTGYICIVDNSVTPPRVIYNENAHVGGGHSPHATHKQSAYSIPFTSLYVQSCPKGATYSVTTA
jgi:hypothetical protein